MHPKHNSLAELAFSYTIDKKFCVIVTDKKHGKMG
jgi:hypothetical protein